MKVKEGRRPSKSLRRECRSEAVKPRFLWGTLQLVVEITPVCYAKAQTFTSRAGRRGQ